MKRNKVVTAISSEQANDIIETQENDGWRLVDTDLQVPSEDIDVILLTFQKEFSEGELDG